MRPLDAYRSLLEMNQAIVTTREAAAAWDVGQRTTNRRLRALEAAGFTSRLRQGLWTLDPDIDSHLVPPYLTAPLPAYVSFASALRRHEMIEQIPRSITVASLRRAQVVPTTVGVYEIHQLAPEVFGGFGGSAEDGYMAEPEKALFDTAYVRAAAGSRAHFPELSLPSEFDHGRMQDWVDRIPSRRLETLVATHLAESLEHAEQASSA